MVVVKPTRKGPSISAHEEEVDQDEPDEERSSREDVDVLPDLGLPLGGFREVEDCEQAASRKKEHEDRLPSEDYGQDEQGGGDEQDARVGGDRRDVGVHEEIDDGAHRPSGERAARLTRIR